MDRLLLYITKDTVQPELTNQPHTTSWHLSYATKQLKHRHNNITQSSTQTQQTAKPFFFLSDSGATIMCTILCTTRHVWRVVVGHQPQLATWASCAQSCAQGLCHQNFPLFFLERDQ